MNEQPSLNIEGLVRLDLRPDEILVITLGGPDLSPDQTMHAQEYLTLWLADHGQPVAGVLILPQGSQIAALRSPERVTHEQVISGEKSINDYRRYLGMRPIPDESVAKAANRDARPGDAVHVRITPGKCVTGIVDDVDGDLLQIETFGEMPDFPKHLTRIHDETRHIPGSWHWPHDNEQPVEPTPEAPAPVTINVHVEGSVLAERDLRQIIDQQIVKHIQRNTPRYPRQH